MPSDRTLTTPTRSTNPEEIRSLSALADDYDDQESLLDLMKKVLRDDQSKSELFQAFRSVDTALRTARDAHASESVIREYYALTLAYARIIEKLYL